MFVFSHGGCSGLAGGGECLYTVTEFVVARPANQWLGGLCKFHGK